MNVGRYTRRTFYFRAAPGTRTRTCSAKSRGYSGHWSARRQVRREGARSTEVVGNSASDGMSRPAIAVPPIHLPKCLVLPGTCGEITIERRASSPLHRTGNCTGAWSQYVPRRSAPRLRVARCVLGGLPQVVAHNAGLAGSSPAPPTGTLSRVAGSEMRSRVFSFSER
jgi:hypothetical protein